MTIKDRSTIERALGMIEGVAVGIPDNASSLLYTAIELIECALQEEEPT